MERGGASPPDRELAVHRTTTVLTIDLPGDLGDRLRQALRQRPGQSLREITIEALEDWLNRQDIEPVGMVPAPSGE